MKEPVVSVHRSRAMEQKSTGEIDRWDSRSETTPWIDRIRWPEAGSAEARHTRRGCSWWRRGLWCRCLACHHITDIGQLVGKGLDRSKGVQATDSLGSMVDRRQPPPPGSELRTMTGLRACPSPVIPTSPLGAPSKIDDVCQFLRTASVLRCARFLEVITAGGPAPVEP